MLQQEGPLVKSQWSGDEITMGCWSLSRPAVFFIGKANGCLEVWNLLENSVKPVHVQMHITSSRITCLKPWAMSCEFPSSQHCIHAFFSWKA